MRMRPPQAPLVLLRVAARLLRRPARLGLLALAMVLGATGCRTVHVNQKTPFVYDSAGLPHVTKRVERTPEHDFLGHWSRTAYVRPAEHVRGAPDARYETVLTQWGTPDWIRKPFTSLEGERVDEWLYLDQARVFQFIGDALVYEGPLTDYEQVLLRRGYPSHVVTVRVAEGRTYDTFVYNGVFTPRLETYTLIDGMIVNSKEGF